MNIHRRDVAVDWVGGEPRHVDPSNDAADPDVGADPPHREGLARRLQWGSERQPGMHHYEAWRSLRLSAWPRLLDGALVSAARRLLADIE